MGIISWFINQRKNITTGGPIRLSPPPTDPTAKICGVPSLAVEAELHHSHVLLLEFALLPGDTNTLVT